MLSSEGPLGQRRSPGKNNGFLVSVWEDRSRSVPLESGTTVVAEQRCDGPFRRWVLASQIWRSELGRMRSNRDQFLTRFWFWLRSSAGLWISLQHGQTARRRRDAAARRGGVWQRCGDVGAARSRECLSDVFALCRGSWFFGRSSGLGRFFWFSCISCFLVVFWLVTVVVLLTISPSERGLGSSSFERGLGLSVLSGCQYDGDLSLHGVWQFWITVSERVNQFIFLLMAGLYRYNWVWLFLGVACQVWLWFWLFLGVAGQVWLLSNIACWRKIWLGVVPCWLMDVICFDCPVTGGSTMVSMLCNMFSMLCNMFVH